MSQAVTLEDIYGLFKESESLYRENERKFQEMRTETDRITREMRAEADRRFQETERLVKEVSRQMGHLQGKWGQFVENLVAPGCEWLFAERGIPVHKVSQRVRARLDDGSNMDVDILVINGRTAILVEVKSTLTVEAVRDHLVRLKRFKQFFPEYRERRILGAVAGIVIEEKADDFARKEGLFVIVQSGDTVRLDNPVDFVPAAH